jgi:hypothetical protein
LLCVIDMASKIEKCDGRRGYTKLGQASPVVPAMPATLRSESTADGLLSALSEPLEAAFRADQDL